MFCIFSLILLISCWHANTTMSQDAPEKYQPNEEGRDAVHASIVEDMPSVTASSYEEDDYDDAIGSLPNQKEGGSITVDLNFANTDIACKGRAKTNTMFRDHKKGKCGKFTFRKTPQMGLQNAGRTCLLFCGNRACKAFHVAAMKDQKHTWICGCFDTGNKGLFRPKKKRPSLVVQKIKCKSTASCTDGIKNQDETAIDCGGATCPACTSCCPSCVVDGGWGEWTEWANCPVTCGGGEHGRTRVCDNPAPQYGGLGCTSDGSTDSENKTCGVNPCPIDGGWGEWTEWAECTVTCGGGTQARTRVCDNPAPEHGGLDCTSDGSTDSDSQACNPVSCPTPCGSVTCISGETCVSDACLCGSAPACGLDADTCDAANAVCLCGTGAACSGATPFCIGGSCLSTIVFQKRGQMGNSQNYFAKSWEEYRAGFASNGELWLGLDQLHAITSSGSWRLDVTLEDWNGATYTARYNRFSVGSATSKYQLTIGQFVSSLSTLGDSMTVSWGINNINGMKFTTKDQDNETCACKCSPRYGYQGWWFRSCGYSHPNGKNNKNADYATGIVWFYGGARGRSSASWKGSEFSITKTGN